MSALLQPVQRHQLVLMDPFGQPAFAVFDRAGQRQANAPMVELQSETLTHPCGSATKNRQARLATARANEPPLQSHAIGASGLHRLA